MRKGTPKVIYYSIGENTEKNQGYHRVNVLGTRGPTAVKYSTNALMV